MNIDLKKKDILIKFFRNECSEKEIDQLKHWMNNEEEQAEIERLIDELWQQSKVLPENFDINSDKIFDQVQKEINHFKNKTENRKITIQHFIFKNRDALRKAAKIAAVFLLPALLLTATYYLAIHHPKDKLVYTTVSVPYGQKVQVLLPDGTKVWINSGSTLRYPKSFHGKTREVHLSGEAFFDVTHNKNHPFIVSTSEINIRVLGTAFNVSAYPDDPVITTTLVRGRVETYRKSLAKIPANRVFLFPGQEAKYSSAEHKFTVDDVNTKIADSWKSGKLMFNNTPLTEIIKKLNRWYNVDIRIQDTTIRNYLYSVNFNDESLQQVKEILEAITPIKFVKEGNKIFVEKDQDRIKEFMKKNDVH
jgi:transmembrane sensor